jgi:uncharacterized membrane protein
LGGAAVIRLAAILWMAFALPALATQDGWPALHDVTGVAPDDALNIRERPDASSPVIGQLSPDASGVEVIRPNERQTWGLVNIGERTGWVSLRYLSRRPGQWDGAFPEIASCYGTEPFWSLRRDGDMLTYSTPDIDAQELMIVSLSGSANRRDSFHMIADGPDGPVVAFLGTEACSDGMSDRAFGISVQLLLGLGAEARHVSGCCTLTSQ